MDSHVGQQKDIERTYYAQIGSDGMRHALAKPFVDDSRAQLLYPVAASGRTGVRKLLDTKPGGWFLMARAMHFRRSLHGLVRLER